MELEKAINICKDFIKENRKRPIILHKAIETILRELEELDKKFKCAIPDDIVAKDYIHKSKIEYKIEELEENGYYEFLEQRDLDKTIKILEELKNY